MGDLIKILFGVVVAVVAWFAANSESNTAVQAAAPPEAVKSLQQKGAAAANRVATETLEPNEIEMIEWRRQLMGRPGLQFFVVFLNDKGQPVDYFVTRGKCSSSGKRLTASWKFTRGQTGVDSDGHSVHGDFVLPRPAEDGMSGATDEYVYCRTVDGKYKQWNGRYYLSDAPIELTIKPLVLNVKK